MVRRHVYRENWIIEFSSACFHAFILNQDDEVEDKTFNALSKAKKWIDKNSKKEYGI
jgi:hypothetical protein